MNVHIEQRWASLHYDITFYDRAGRYTMVMRRDDDSENGSGWKWETVENEHNSEIAPSLVLSGDALEALLLEAGKVIPATHATERHLVDATAVRDRLLTLVEQGWQA